MIDIVTAAIALIQDPDRKWGRSFKQSLSEIIGQAITKASPTPLKSEQFEMLRSHILHQLRTPA